MRLLYSIVIYLFYSILWIASFFHPKAKQWIDGRKGQFKRLSGEIEPGDRIIWFHCASLGEFEQGRPVMEAFRRSFSDHKILLTFFSPSGYEIRKNTPLADMVYYLPLDSPQNVRKFISIVNPRMAIFVKYEYWFNFINELSKNKVPSIFISAIFLPGQYIFKPWGKWALHQLQKITHFFVQDERSLKLLNNAKVYHAEVGGDTRFDRVLKLSSENIEFPVIENFNSSNSNLLVAGSTWPADEDILLKLMEQLQESLKIVIAPHEVDSEHINQLIQKFKAFNPQKFSDFDNHVNSRVLIIDSIGMLSYLYRYAKIAYIGGGFGVGIHNLLEAVTYGIPVIFGPNYKRFKEAVELLEVNAGYTISNAAECHEIYSQLISDDLKYKESCIAADSYVKSNAGATIQIIDKIKTFLIAD